MKVKRPSGIKRITIICTFIFPIIFLILNGSLASDPEANWGFMIPLAILPAIVYKVGYWIADGFQRDQANE